MQTYMRASDLSVLLDIWTGLLRLAAPRTVSYLPSHPCSLPLRVPWPGHWPVSSGGWDHVSPKGPGSGLLSLVFEVHILLDPLFLRKSGVSSPSPGFFLPGQL